MLMIRLLATALLAVLFAAPQSGCATTALPAECVRWTEDAAVSAEARPLIDQARRDGTVRVIVQLAQEEGVAPAVRQQRLISQMDTCRYIRPGDTRLLESLPGMAMNVDVHGLYYLTQSPMVARVMPDELMDTTSP
jgi:hypothetical protein